MLNGFDARCIAAATNQPTILERLKHCALDLDAPCEDYDVHSGKLRQIITPLTMASWFGAPDVVHFLVAQRDITIDARARFTNCQRDGSTALSWAVLYGRAHC